MMMIEYEGRPYTAYEEAFQGETYFMSQYTIDLALLQNQLFAFPVYQKTLGTILQGEKRSLLEPVCNRIYAQYCHIDDLRVAADRQIQKRASL